MKENYNNNTVFSKDGIELSYLLTEFVDKCGGFSKLKDLTSFDMIQKYILPFTNDKRCSYVELIRGNHCKYVGKPNIYLIYPSDSKIVDVLELLKFNYGSGEGLYIWFDLFCYNQHIPLTLTKDWWNHSLKPIFEGLTEVALFYFLDETVSSPFQRTWCLFESFTAKGLNIPFHIIMKPEDKHLFFNEIRKGEYNEIFLSGIDLLNSETSVFEEKNQLVNICSEIWTVKQVNEGVLSLIQDWSISLGKELISSFQFTPEESINIHSLIGKVFIEQKKYQESLFFYEKCFVYQKQILPMNEEKMLQFMKQLISLYANLQKYFQAECLTKELITILKHQKSPDDNDNEILFGHIYSLGQLYEFQGKFIDAENCYQDVYQFKKKGLLGESQKYNQIETKEPNLLDLMNALGNVYANQGKFILAEQFYSKCYRKRQELFGEDHPKTLSALTNLALVNADLGKLDQALEYLDLVLEKFKTQLGESHPDTLACMANQAGIHVQLENYDLACHLYEIILAKRRELLKTRIIRSHEHENDDHFDFDVLQSMNDLAVVYTYQQKYSQAESLYQECYEKLLKFYHHHHRPLEEEEQYQQEREHYHPQLLAAIHNLGYLYEIQEIYEKSCNYYSLCYEKSVITLGKDHPKTLASLFHYAKVLYHLKEYEHAQNLFEECLFRRKKYYRHFTAGHRQQEDQQNGSENNSVDPLMFLQQQKESSSHFHPQEDNEEEQEQQSLLHIGEKDEEDDDHQQENKAIETHPDIQATKNYLILIYQKLQKFSKAKELCESSLVLKGTNASSIINGSRSILEGHGEEEGGGGGGNETMNGEELISNSIILSNLANIEFMEGNYSKAESFLQESYDNRKETLGENHPITISAMNTLAHFYNSTQFDLEKAKELYEKTLKQMKGAVPGAHSAHSAHPSQLLTTPHSFEHHKDQQNNIILSPRTDGNTHHHNNMTAAAAHHSHSHSHSHAMVLQHHQNTILSTMNNLATIYLSEGNYSQAESYLFQSYEQMKVIYSEKHPNTLSILNNIGNFYYQQKQFQQAFHYYQQCYCYRKEILGEEHEDTLQSLNNLGNLYQIYFQNYQQAKICYEKCYFLRLRKHSTGTAVAPPSSSSTASVGGNESIGSAISLETLTSMNNLGVLYILLKEFWHAKELLMKCFHLRQELLGIDHLDTLMTLNNLASVLVYLEEYPQAKELYELCLSERIKKYSFLKEIKKKQNLHKEEEEIASVRKNLEFVEKKLLE